MQEMAVLAADDEKNGVKLPTPKEGRTDTHGNEDAGVEVDPSPTSVDGARKLSDIAKHEDVDKNDPNYDA